MGLPVQDNIAPTMGKGNHMNTREHQGRRALLGGAATLLLAAHLPAWAKGIKVEVWKDPDCGCCKDWVAHLQANGFLVKVNETGNEAVRKQLGLDPRYGSCHTARIGGYAIEGHVPAREIHRLLRERLPALGLSVPGMPVGAPGMDGPVYGGRKDPFQVLLLARNGSATVYQAYERK
jgi:hypothetical protein